MKLKAVLVLLALLGSMQHAYADPLSDCINTLERDSVLQPISDKVSLAGKTDRLFSMMANESFPTSSEKEAIFAWATKRERCINDNPPPNNPITQVNREGFNAVQSLILDLYKGIITYGQFTRQRQEIAKIVDAKTQQIIGQYQQQQMQQQQQYQQQEEYLYQACMNRAGDIYQRNACQMERAGRQLGGALSR